MTTLADIQAVIQSIKNDDPTSISLLQYALALLTGYVENNPPGGGITQLTGDVTAGPGSGSQVASVAKIQGVAVSSTPPTAAGDILTWNGTSWAPATALWSKSGTELSPATAGDTVQIEIPVGTAGLTVEDTPASLLSEVRPGVVHLTDNLKVAELNTVSASLLLKGDSGEAPPVVPTITAQDYDSSPTPLDLVVGELRVNGASGAAGEVLTSNGPGAAPTWQAGGGGGAAYDQMLYVADGADPALANGSPAFPFASISAALASISDASPTKRYTVMITAGEYTEAGTVNLKPNVFLCGVVPDAVRITAASWVLDPTFTGGADNRTGIHNCIVTGAVNLNFTTVTSTAGKFYARSSMFVSAVTLTGYNNPIVQAQFSGCQFFSLVTVQGVNVGVANDNIHFSGLTLTQSPFASVPTIWSATGGTLSGTLTATTTVNDFNRRISLFCKSFWMGTVNIDGPSTYLDYTVDCLPTAGATVTGGASLVLINPASGVGANTELSNLVFPTAVNNPIIPATTNATNMGDWNKQWMFSFGYVHLSTGTELYLASAGASASPDTAGRPIFIEADTYGLDTNVDGGDISLTTQAGVSGTGTRGNVNINTREINLSLAGAMNVNAAPGNSGDVLTSQGAGAAPVWAAPASSSSRTYPINVSNNAGSTVWGPAVWLDSGFNPVTSSARFYLPFAGDIGRLILSANRVTTVAEFTTAAAPFAGVFDASFSAGSSVLSPGWYVFGVQNSSGSGNTVECLGIRLT